MRDLGGKRVLITGGAGGIGLALARRFGAEGARPLLADIDGEAASRAAARLASGHGVEAGALTLDVTRPESVAAARQAALEDGPVDVLVNNAGVVHGGTFGEVSLERHLETYRVNLLGAVAVTHALLDDLVSRPEAWLVNIASASGLVGLPWGSTYASSKWGLIGLSESLRLELRETGRGHVGVTVACPSYAGTGMFAGVRTPRGTRMLDPQDLADRVVAAVRRGRPWVLTPWLVRWVPLLRGLLPTAAFDALARSLGATTGMRHWRGGGNGTDPG